MSNWLLGKTPSLDYLEWTTMRQCEFSHTMRQVEAGEVANTLNKQTDTGDYLPTADPHPLFLHLPLQT